LIEFKPILDIRELGERSRPSGTTILIKKALGNQKLGSRTKCDFLGPAYRFEFSWNNEMKIISLHDRGYLSAAIIL
jgi:hypothetical protein